VTIVYAIAPSHVRAVKHLLFCYEDWEVPENFDVHKSTCENYRADDRQVYGPYADIRATLDFEYHGNYTKKRQAFQDTLIRNVVGAAVEKEGPWIVFTAGICLACTQQQFALMQ
jgi:hypothetical protein